MSKSELLALMKLYGILHNFYLKIILLTMWWAAAKVENLINLNGHCKRHWSESIDVFIVFLILIHNPFGSNQLELLGGGENSYFSIKLVHVAALESPHLMIKKKSRIRLSWYKQSILTAFDKRMSSIIKFNFVDYKTSSSIKCSMWRGRMCVVMLQSYDDYVKRALL